MLACSFCEKPVADHEGAREFRAWEIRVTRHKRRTTRKEWTGRVACVSCTLDLSHGFEPNTPKLL